MKTKPKRRDDFYLNRGFVAELRAKGEDDEKAGHIVEGLAAVYDQETQIGDPEWGWIEVIRKGAFDETDFSDVKLLINHDFNGLPLARSRRNNKSDKPNTMKLWVDDEGVKIEADLDTQNNEQARALYSAIERGDLDGMSFCFFVAQDGATWNDDLTRREITKIAKVIEVSAVNFPAYGGTNIDARSLESDKKAVETARELLERSKTTKKTNYTTKAILSQYKAKG